MGPPRPTPGRTPPAMPGAQAMPPTWPKLTRKFTSMADTTSCSRAHHRACKGRARGTGSIERLPACGAPAPRKPTPAPLRHANLPPAAPDSRRAVPAAVSPSGVGCAGTPPAPTPPPASPYPCGMHRFLAFTQLAPLLLHAGPLLPQPLLAGEAGLHRARVRDHDGPQCCGLHARFWDCCEQPGRGLEVCKRCPRGKLRPLPTAALDRLDAHALRRPLAGRPRPPAASQTRWCPRGCDAGAGSPPCAWAGDGDGLVVDQHVSRNHPSAHALGSLKPRRRLTHAGQQTRPPLPTPGPRWPRPQACEPRPVTLLRVPPVAGPHLSSAAD